MNYSSNISKYIGSILSQNNKYIYKVIKNGKLVHKKEFSYVNISPIIAHQNAIDYKKQWSIDNNYVKNYYTINNNIIKIHLKLDKFFITDLSNIDKVDKYIWYLMDGYVATMITENKKRQKIYFHNYIANNENVVHKDCDKMNNTLSNLLITDDKIAKKVHNFNHIKRKDNTSGFTGVYKGKYKNREYWEVKGYDFNGNHIYRKYSIDKYGVEGGYGLACDFRDKFINNSFDLTKKSI
jgi:hypothetical protein